MSELEQKPFFLDKDYEVVEFTNDIHPRIKIEPMYFNLGFSSSPLVFGRYAVLQRLQKVIPLLPETYGLLIWDIYRPRAVQAKLFDWMREEIKAKYPLFTDEENYAEASKYISVPSKIGDEYCPPHLSGGAIDLTLFNIINEEPLDMGTPFDDCSERAGSDYFNTIKNLSAEEEQIKDRRQILRHAMEEAGFTAYEYEWWHFDIGNIFWAKKMNCTAPFGPLFDDEEMPIAGVGFRNFSS